jgi:drug/metabolite transporter (DMT)-like permease
MLNPRVSLLIGLLCISIFPVLVKWTPVSGLTSAFYRMFFGFMFLLPWLIVKRKFIWPDKKLLIPIALCGIIFATDIAVWNLAIHYSNATQATLLTNLSPVWVGIGAFLFLKDKPRANFWIGTFIAVAGMIVLIGPSAFMEMRLDKGFALAVISGMLYASYMLVSKSVLNKIDIISFMTVSMAVSSVYLLMICLFYQTPLWNFSGTVWSVFVVEGLICQLLGWLTISYAIKKMNAQRVSLSLLSQALVTGILAWLFIDEAITLPMIVGGIIILAGIAITFMKDYNLPAKKT